MAIQQLNLKLDQMNEELVDQQQRKEIASVPMPETVAYGTMTPAQTELQDEGIQVAGGRGEVLREILGKVKKVEIRKPPAAPLTPQKPQSTLGLLPARQKPRLLPRCKPMHSQRSRQKHLPANVLKCKRSVLSRNQPQKYRQQQYSICQRWRQRKTSSQPLKP